MAFAGLRSSGRVRLSDKSRGALARDLSALEVHASTQMTASSTIYFRRMQVVISLASPTVNYRRCFDGLRGPRAIRRGPVRGSAP